MPFQILRSDITKLPFRVDAIVNTANPRPIVGNGTDNAVHKSAGSALLKARKKIGSIARGQSAITPAFNLNASYVIHTVGPRWRGGNNSERETLRSCYDTALKLAEENGCTSIAFPLISAGMYGFPKDEALEIANSAIGDFLLEHEMSVFLVVFNTEAFKLSKQLQDEVKSFIDDYGVFQSEIENYWIPRNELLRDEFDEDLSAPRILKAEPQKPESTPIEAESVPEEQKAAPPFSKAPEPGEQYVRHSLSSDYPGGQVRFSLASGYDDTPLSENLLEELLKSSYGTKAQKAPKKVEKASRETLKAPSKAEEAPREAVKAPKIVAKFPKKTASAPKEPAEQLISVAPEERSVKRTERKRFSDLFTQYTDLDELLHHNTETFSDALVRIIDENGWKDSEVYKRAGMDKKLFNKIVNTKDYHPTKPNALLLAVALHLNLDQTRDFIAKAGYVLTETSTFDLIVAYFINKGEYNYIVINEVLFANGQGLLSKGY